MDLAARKLPTIKQLQQNNKKKRKKTLTTMKTTQKLIKIRKEKREKKRKMTSILHIYPRNHAEIAELTFGPKDKKTSTNISK